MLQVPVSNIWVMDFSLITIGQTMEGGTMARITS